MKKSEFVSALTQELTAGKLSKTLLERIAYTVAAYAKDAKSVDVPTLVELKADIAAEQEALVAQVVEASIVPAVAKPKPKTKAKAAVVEQPAIIEATPERVNAPAEKAKPVKIKAAKPEIKPAVAEATESKASGLPPFARMFPDILEDANLGKLAKRADIKSYSEFKAAIEKDEEIILAMYWTPRMLKKYEYAAFYRVPAVKSFPSDLDLITPVMFLDKVNRALCVSAYTDAVVFLEAADFEYIEDSNGADKYLVRMSYAVEFELYTPATK